MKVPKKPGYKIPKKNLTKPAKEKAKTIWEWVEWMLASAIHHVGKFFFG